MHVSPLYRVAKLFGGASAMARAISRRPSTVSNWIYRDNAGRRELEEILLAAKKLGLPVTPEMFFNPLSNGENHEQD